MGDVGALVVRIGADASSLAREFDKMSSGAANFGKTMSRMGSLAATAFLGAAAAATAMTIEAGKQAEEIEQLSKITGQHSSELQHYDVLFNRVGLSGQDVTAMFKALAKNMEDAKNGTGNAAERFRQLGIDITKVTNTDQLFRMVADGVGRFSNEAAKAAAVSDLLGKAGLRFIPAFDGGAKAIDEAIAASKQLGEILNERQLATLTRMDDAVDDLGVAWKRFGQQVGVAIAPSLQVVVQALIDMLAWGSRVFKEFDVWLDVLGIRTTHLALKMGVLANMDLSGWFFDNDAWKNAMAQMEMINGEADKLIAKRREQAKLEGDAKTKDTRPNIPQLHDTKKELAEARSLADAIYQANQDLFKNEQTIAAARMALADTVMQKELEDGTKNEMQIAEAKEKALNRMEQFTVTSLETELANLEKFYAFKVKLYGDDEKSFAEKEKFKIETGQKMISLQAQIQAAEMKQQQTKIQGAMAVDAAHKKMVLQPLEDELLIRKANADVAAAVYRNEPQLIGYAITARDRAMAALEAEGNLRREQINQNINDERRRVTAIVALEGELSVKRQDIVSQFPTFWEQQLQTIVNSNTFAMGMLVNTWTSSIAQGIVQWNSFTSVIKSAWTSTLTALVQGGLNFFIQWGAQAALTASKELGLQEALNAAKLALYGEDAAAKTITAAAGGKAEAAAAAATVGALAAVGEASIAMAGAIVGMTVAIYEGLAAAAAATIVGAELAPGFAAAGVAIGAAGAGAIGAAQGVMAGAVGGVSGAIAGLAAFKEGGISFGPAIFGEAGPEAAIPLNNRGAKFMQDAFGIQGQQPIVVHVQTMLNDRVLADELVEPLIPALRARGIPV